MKAIFFSILAIISVSGSALADGVTPGVECNLGSGPPANCVFHQDATLTPPAGGDLLICPITPPGPPCWRTYLCNSEAGHGYCLLRTGIVNGFSDGPHQDLKCSPGYTYSIDNTGNTDKCKVTPPANRAEFNQGVRLNSQKNTLRTY